MSAEETALKVESALLYPRCSVSNNSASLDSDLTTKRLVNNLLSALPLVTTTITADPVYPDRPKDIRVTGTLLAPSAKDQKILLQLTSFLEMRHCCAVGSVEKSFS